MNAGVVLSETPLGSVTGDLVAVPAAAAEETPAPAAPEDNRYTVSLSMMGFEVTREFTAKIDLEARRIYLS
jgi:hypothetical protein